MTTVNELFENIEINNLKETIRIKESIIENKDNNIMNLIQILKNQDDRFTELLKENKLLEEIISDSNDSDDNVSISEQNLIQDYQETEEVEENPYQPLTMTLCINDISINLENIGIPPRQLHLIKRHYNEDNDCPICLENIKKEELIIPNCSCNALFHSGCFSRHLSHRVGEFVFNIENDIEDEGKVLCPCCRFDFNE